MMNVQVKSSNGITLVPVDSKLMSNRKIFIEGEIDAEKACEFVKEVMLLNAEDSQRPIDSTHQLSRWRDQLGDADIRCYPGK